MTRAGPPFLHEYMDLFWQFLIRLWSPTNIEFDEHILRRIVIDVKGNEINQIKYLQKTLIPT